MCCEVASATPLQALTRHKGREQRTMRGLLLMAVVCGAASANPPFVNPGTPGGVPPSYDCKVREHAWEYGKTTLPQRGDFKTLYDALQLQACGVEAPSGEDVWVPPTYATPSSGVVIYVDAKASSGGDGSKTSPFSTLVDAVAAAAGKGAATIVLYAGTYHTEQVQLGTEHAKLTIQNFEGQEAVVSGAVPVKVNGKGAWTQYDATHNTWKLDVKGQGFTEITGLRLGTERAIRAKYPNGHPESSSVHYTSNQYKEGWIVNRTTYVFVCWLVVFVVFLRTLSIMSLGLSLHAFLFLDMCGGTLTTQAFRFQPKVDSLFQFGTKTALPKRTTGSPI